MYTLSRTLSVEACLMLLLSLLAHAGGFILPNSKTIHKRSSSPSSTSVLEKQMMEEKIVVSDDDDDTDSTTVMMTSSTSLISSKPFDNFEYDSHWYPVSWAEDIPYDQPTKFTVFDTDYVVAKLSKDDSVICMLDACPHKYAALSEGRVTSGGQFQCAYHGWSFNGTTGDCVEIPQMTTKKMKQHNSQSQSSSLPERFCGTAVPAMIHQGMVWLFPGGNLEKALLSPPPPTIPELDQEGFKVSHAVRDFPVDWSILMSNILDPDHGLFAHQMKSFDMYSASRELQMEVEEEFPNGGKEYKLTTRIDAVDKLLALDQSLREEGNEKLREKKKKQVTKNQNKEKQDIKKSTTTYFAPCVATMGRRDPVTRETAFTTNFWVTPVGTGRSRFMSASAAKSPIAVPRWITHILLNNFLDQDTYLLATQQNHVLKAEVNAVKDVIKNHGEDKLKSKSYGTNARSKLYKFGSPTDKLVVRVDKFWDKTLHRAPKRVSTLLALDQAGGLTVTPSREFILDREIQHLKICPDSQVVVRRCTKIQKMSKLIIGSVAVSKVYATLFPTTSKFATLLKTVLKPKLVVSTILLSLLSSWLAGKIRRNFYFKYTEEYRNRDLKKIPGVWLDP